MNPRPPRVRWSEYRDDGLWTVLSLVTWFGLMGLASRVGLSCGPLPHSGFVAPRFPLSSYGRASTLYPAIGPRNNRLVSIRVRRILNTEGAHLWRLTCVWDSLKLASPLPPSGNGSPPVGSSKVRATDGAATSSVGSSRALSGRPT